MILYTKGNLERKRGEKKKEKEKWSTRCDGGVNIGGDTSCIWKLTTKGWVFEMFNHNTQNLHRTMYTETVHDTKTVDCFNVYTTTKQANLK